MLLLPTVKSQTCLHPPLRSCGGEVQSSAQNPSLPLWPEDTFCLSAHLRVFSLLCSISLFPPGTFHWHLKGPQFSQVKKSKLLSTLLPPPPQLPLFFLQFFKTAVHPPRLHSLTSRSFLRPVRPLWLLTLFLRQSCSPRDHQRPLCDTCDRRHCPGFISHRCPRHPALLTLPAILKQSPPWTSHTLHFSCYPPTSPETPEKESSADCSTGSLFSVRPSHVYIPWE